MADIVDTIELDDFIDECLEPLQKRLEGVIDILNDEYERLVLVVNFIMDKNDPYIKEYMIHNIVSSLMSIETARSILTGDTPNYEIDGIIKKLKIKEHEHEKKYRDRVRGSNIS